MRSVQNLVARGFTHYTTGTVVKEKFNAVAQKLKTQYQTEMTSQQRWRARKKGLATTHFLSFYFEWPGSIFILLATDGQGDIHEFEKLKDSSKKNNELKSPATSCLKCQGKAHLLHGRGKWRIRRLIFWRKRLKRAIRWKSKKFINQCVYSLSRLPKFHAIRQQGFQLIQYAKADWKRSYKNSEPCPFDSIFLGFYGRYQTAAKVNVDSLKVKKHQNNSLWLPSRTKSNSSGVFL